MGIATIRRVIQDAKDFEAEHGSMEQALRQRLPTLRHRLILSHRDPSRALLAFCIRYVEYVPDFLLHIQDSARAGGAASKLTPLLNMAEDFFLAPPDALAEEGGLQALMDEAFLAQRLIEELDERYQRSGAGRLVDVDMTRANIIALHLIGEPLASRLEGLVRRSLELVSPALGWGGLSQPGMMAASISLPCMSQEIGVDLRLPSFDGQSSEAEG
ncbi:MAG: hypothetical protein AAGI24_16530 [Pseudomonadota bacterium]